ncbi:hypothetical protein Mgra_00002693 [Meloidogyne graminicola]|uniref:Uncharacterized protein n=1 Tax=Meloidogyne graminicola TaxID=189291 RepID=A0A8S9ZWE6_9BILA|nr:hypothetical protein Mgra_00002693 [Meloidogyne graminicola]
MCHISSDQHKHLAVLNELNSFPCSESYWARKSRMLTLESEFSPLEFKLLEFDVALMFNDVKDLSFSAQKIFQLEKSEKVRQRISQLFSVLLSGKSDRRVSSELVGELSMDNLQEMFFFAFPEQRNSTKGSLQVYLTFACNQPNSLCNVATKLFAYYLGASGEFQLDSNEKESKYETISAMDAVLFRLFDSLIQSNFGDLSLHNVVQIFQILLRNCFADSIGLIPNDFYSRPGISILSSIERPSVCWHYCLPVLSHIWQKRGQLQLTKIFEPFPTNFERMGQTLEKVFSDPNICHQLAINVEFVRLTLRWSFASPLKDIQIS